MATVYLSGVEGAAGVATEVDAVRSRAKHQRSMQGKTPVAAVEGDEARVVDAAVDAVGAVADVGVAVVEDRPATAIVLLPTQPPSNNCFCKLYLRGHYSSFALALFRAQLIVRQKGHRRFARKESGSGSQTAFREAH
jgi:hypothetical protein